MTKGFTTLDMVCRTRSLKDIDLVIASHFADFEHSRGILYVNTESMHAGEERKKRCRPKNLALQIIGYD